MDNFVCQSNTKGIKYYFFELFDEKWKDDIYGGVEGHWGLLYQKCVPRVSLTANADRFPTAKPSKASPSPTVRFDTWTLLHPVTALTITLPILWLRICSLPIVGSWLHLPSHASDYSVCSIANLIRSFSIVSDTLQRLLPDICAFMCKPFFIVLVTATFHSLSWTSSLLTAYGSRNFFCSLFFSWFLPAVGCYGRWGCDVHCLECLSFRTRSPRCPVVNTVLVRKHKI